MPSDVDFIGYGPNEYLAQSVAAVGVEYTWPIKDIQRGWVGFPITFGRLSGGLKLEGVVMDGIVDSAAAIGFELTQDMDFLSQFDMKASFGVYHVKDDFGHDTRTVFTLTGIPFIKSKSRY